jgi:hypothetical protein
MKRYLQTRYKYTATYRNFFKRCLLSGEVSMKHNKPPDPQAIRGIASGLGYKNVIVTSIYKA